MTRWEYYADLAPAIIFIGAYYLTGKHDVEWLFAATFMVIHAKGNQIRANIKEAKA